MRKYTLADGCKNKAYNKYTNITKTNYKAYFYLYQTFGIHSILREAFEIVIIIAENGY